MKQTSVEEDALGKSSVVGREVLAESLADEVSQVVSKLRRVVMRSGLTVELRVVVVVGRDAGADRFSTHAEPSVIKKETLETNVESLYRS